MIGIDRMKGMPDSAYIAHLWSDYFYWRLRWEVLGPCPR